MTAFVGTALWSGCIGGKQMSCPVLEGEPWVPAISGAAESNHDTSVHISKDIYSVNAPVVGYDQAAPTSKEVEIDIPVPDDLGVQGSLSFVAEVTRMRYSGFTIKAAPYPMLVALNDGVSPTDFIHLPREGNPGDCAASGYNSAGCEIPSGPAAYSSFNQWLYRQRTGFGLMTVNTFPTCNWSATTPGAPACSFTSDFFPPSTYGETPHLRWGTTYHARFLVLDFANAQVPAGSSVDITVTAIRKKDVEPAAGGAIDVNVVLVGTANVKASRTDKGKQNLNLLLSNVQQTYSQAGVNVRLGKVTALEWPCEATTGGGDVYANPELAQQGRMIATATRLLPGLDKSNAVNLFMISAFADDSSVVGLASAIGGPLLPISASSGVAVSTFSKLEKMNPLCAVGDPCPESKQDQTFYDVSETLSHEVGHFLGLNHPTEARVQKTGSGQFPAFTHDSVDDTPACGTYLTSSDGKMRYISASSCSLDTTCSQACPGYLMGVSCRTAPECQFNHVMWVYTKRFVAGVGPGEGALFSRHSGLVVNLSPFVQ
jgi:hypothetical protein